MPYPEAKTGIRVRVRHPDHLKDFGNGIPEKNFWPGVITSVEGGDVIDGYSVRVVFWTLDGTEFVTVPYRDANIDANSPDAVAIPE